MATKQRKGIGTDTSATVMHGEDSAGKPRAPFVTNDGGLAAAGVAGAAGGVPVVPQGTVARVPEPKTVVYDAGPPVLELTMTPKIGGLTFALSDAAPESVTLSSGFITITIDGGTSDETSLAATFAASDAAAVCDIAIDTGTFPVGASVGPTELWTERTIGMAAEYGATHAGTTIPLLADDDGKTEVRPHIVAIGSATAATSATAVVGTTGRLPADVTLTIDAGMNITVHPLCGGVTVAVATAAAAAVSATGKAVTLTALNTGATTVAAMQALIAASSSVAALLTITGTAGDTFDAAVAIAATDLWTEGTIPANVLVVMGSDGYYWPASGYNETLGHVAARVHDTDLQAALTAGVGTKDLLINGETVGAIALPAGVSTVLCAWVNLSRYLYVSYFLYAILGNPVTQFVARVSPTVGGVPQPGAVSAGPFNVGSESMSEYQTLAVGPVWNNTFSVAAFGGLRFEATSAIGGSVRFSVVGYREG